MASSLVDTAKKKKLSIFYSSGSARSGPTTPKSSVNKEVLNIKWDDENKRSVEKKGIEAYK